jgi:cytoskeletal protein RodZ
MDKLKGNKPLIIGAIVVVLIGGVWYLHRHSAKKAVAGKAKTAQESSLAADGSVSTDTATTPTKGKSGKHKKASATADQTASPDTAASDTTVTPTTPTASAEWQK